MKLNNIILNIIEEQNVLKTRQTKPIVNAIVNRNPISFFYTGPRKPKEKSVKPGNRYDVKAVALGANKRGNLVIRAYVQPPSVSKRGFDEHGWRTFLISRMSNIKVDTNQVFDDNIPLYKKGDDGSFSVTYVTSNWDEIRPVKPDINPVNTEPETLTPVEPEISVEPETPVEPETSVEPEISNNELPQPKTRVNPSVEPETDLTGDNNSHDDLPQPKPEIKPSETPDIDDLYKKKVDDWKKTQISLNKNTSPGEGTRNRLRKDSESEYNKNNQLTESVKRIKYLMLI